MANAFRVFGLSPVKHLITGDFNGQGNLYQIAAADTNAYYIGDPVVSSGSGDANGVAGITLAAATGAIRGVVLGLGPSTLFGPAFEAGLFNPNNLNQTFRPSGAQATDWYALVADDPNIIFEVSEPITGTPLTAAAIGDNINLVVGTGNGFQSGWTIANTGNATTSTLQMRLLGLARRSDNAFGLGAHWLTKINNHELSAGTAGV
jgi:hypothetical protein